MKSDFRQLQIITFLVLLVVDNGLAFLIDTRIVGGESIEIEQAPYQLQVIRDNLQVCGAALISRKVAISAAHCFRTPGEIKILAGTTERFSFDMDDGILVDVETVIQHPDYDAKKFDFDLAIIILREELPLSEKIQPVKLPLQDEELPIGRLAEVSGYGLLDEITATPSTNLQTVQVDIIDQEECQQKYSRGGIIILDRSFCAGSREAKDACQGDSGGPLVVDFTIYGIISWGIHCGSPKYPGVYTNVARFVDYIRGFIN